MGWDAFAVHVSAQIIKLLATSVYTTGNNGFIEIELYGTVLDDYITGCRAECSSTVPVANFSTGAYICSNILDGTFQYASGEWVSDAGGAGAWVRIIFPGFYDLNQTRIMQRFYSGAQFKDIQLIANKDEVITEVNIILASFKAF